MYDANFKLDGDMNKQFIVRKANDDNLESILNEAVEEGYALIHLCTTKHSDRFGYEYNGHLVVFKKIEEK